MTAKQRCAELVNDSYSWHAHQCSRSGVLFEDGKWWCRQHAPSSVAARKAKWEAKYQAESAKSYRHWKREQAQRNLMDAAVEARDALPSWAAMHVALFLENQEPEDVQ